MNKKQVRLLFALLLGILSVVFLLSMNKIEPYPAPVYPSFGKAPIKEEVIQINKPEFVVYFENSDSQEVDYFKLFNNIPISHVNHLVVNNLNPERKVDLERWQAKPFKSFQLGRYTIEWRRTPNLPTKEEIARRKQFFRNRITETTGRQDPVNLHITWYRYDFVFGKGIVWESKRQVYETEINLVDESI
ncbi:MAG: hypothetical protein O3C43_02350 [Verrucomicrobia bacterium]|nr:hypothetical protein [Verrucomicrobiota bacterium]MDA1065325.1 hypothetical protein [Verrucomicrobiota bacterium]